MSRAREVRTKIASIGNTQKITKAMELVAASKMRKAQERMSMSKPYAEKIRQVIRHVAASQSESHHPYLTEPKIIKTVGFIVITTDRGLCGGLNVNLLRTVLTEMMNWEKKEVAIDLCLIGRKAEAFFTAVGGNIVGLATHLGDTPKVQDLVGIVKVMLDNFVKKTVDAVYIVSNEFINTMIQKPVIRRLLPLPQNESPPSYWDYIYEPDSAKILLDMLMSRYIESQVYQAVIENLACEQSARMVAMKSATENAIEIIKELKLIYNKARQASITREIAEIIGGAAAIEG